MIHSGLKTGHLVCRNNSLVEVSGVNDKYVVVRTRTTTISGTYCELDLESIPLKREMLISCFGFNEDGILKMDVRGRYFYLREKDGHIILSGNDLVPLIHFWDVNAVHQMQNLYAGLMEEPMPADMEALYEYCVGAATESSSSKK